MTPELEKKWKLKEIEFHLSLNNIKQYHINDDFSVDVFEDMMICQVSNNKLPIQFNKVQGDFIIDSLNLETLEGSPKIVTGNFSAKYNQLKTLKFSPESCQNYIINDNQLESLEGISRNIQGNIICNNNKITSLKGLSVVKGSLNIENNNLDDIDTTLNINENLFLSSNPLKNITTWNHQIGGHISLRGLRIKLPKVFQDNLSMFKEIGGVYSGSFSNEAMKSLFEKNQLEKSVHKTNDNHHTIKL